MSDKIKVYRGVEVDSSGVSTVWRWDCPYEGCVNSSLSVEGVTHGVYLFWRNAFRGAFRHVRDYHGEVRYGR